MKLKLKEPKSALFEVGTNLSHNVITYIFSNTDVIQTLNKSFTVSIKCNPEKLLNKKV